MKWEGENRAGRRGVRMVLAALMAAGVFAVAPAPAAAQTCVKPPTLPVSQLREGSSRMGSGRESISYSSRPPAL